MKLVLTEEEVRNNILNKGKVAIEQTGQPKIAQGMHLCKWNKIQTVQHLQCLLCTQTPWMVACMSHCPHTQVPPGPAFIRFYLPVLWEPTIAHKTLNQESSDLLLSLEQMLNLLQCKHIFDQLHIKCVDAYLATSFVRNDSPYYTTATLC
jgi:hypothetical protein